MAGRTGVRTKRTNLKQRKVRQGEYDYLKEKLNIRRSSRHKAHACMFCLRKVRRINDHFRRRHSDEQAVLNIIKMKKSSERAWEWTKLVREGDDFYNCLLSIEGRGGEEFLSVRRPLLPRKQRKYVICSGCSGRILSKNFRKHKILCKG